MPCTVPIYSPRGSRVWTIIPKAAPATMTMPLSPPVPRTPDYLYPTTPVPSRVPVLQPHIVRQPQIVRDPLPQLVRDPLPGPGPCGWDLCHLVHPSTVKCGDAWPHGQGLDPCGWHRGQPTPSTPPRMPRPPRVQTPELPWEWYDFAQQDLPRATPCRATPVQPLNYRRSVTWPRRVYSPAHTRGNGTSAGSPRHWHLAAPPP